MSFWAVVSKPIFGTAQRSKAPEMGSQLNSESTGKEVLGRNLISMARRVQVSAEPPHFTWMVQRLIAQLKAFHILRLLEGAGEPSFQESPGPPLGLGSRSCRNGVAFPKPL